MFERVEPLVDVGGHDPRLDIAEDGVAGEDDAFLGHVHRDLAGRVAGREQVEGVIADVQRDVAGENDLPRFGSAK